MLERGWKRLKENASGESGWKGMRVKKGDGIRQYWMTGADRGWKWIKLNGSWWEWMKVDEIGLMLMKVETFNESWWIWMKVNKRG